LNRWKISGYPKNILVNVYSGTEAEYARRFLNSKLQAGRNKAPPTQPYGSKWPNKHPWKEIVNSLNEYNLREPQKNMLRRVDIAVAAQQSKGRWVKRDAVNFNIKNMNRNAAVQKQKTILNAKRAAQRQAAQSNVFYNAPTEIKPSKNNNSAKRALEQHRQSYGQF
jgi:hypothetical protein